MSEAKFKVGDVVAVLGDYGAAYRGVVERVMPSGRFTVEGQSGRTFNPDGYERASAMYHRRCVVAWSESIAARVEAFTVKRIREQLADVGTWRNLTDATVREVWAIVEKAKGPAMTMQLEQHQKIEKEAR